MSESYYVLSDNMVHIVNDGLRLCTGQSDQNKKYDNSANLFAMYCEKCQEEAKKWFLKFRTIDHESRYANHLQLL